MNSKLSAEYLFAFDTMERVLTSVADLHKGVKDAALKRSILYVKLSSAPMAAHDRHHSCDTEVCAIECIRSSPVLVHLMASFSSF